MVEYAIITPILVFVLALGLDIGQVVAQYQSLVDVIQTGLRFGQQIPELEFDARGSPNPETGLRTTINLATCNGGLIVDRIVLEGDPSYIPPPNHLRVHERLAVTYCLQHASRNFINTTEIKLRSKLLQTNLPGAEDQDTLEIRVQAIYRPFFPFPFSLPLSATAKVPYLY